MNDIIISIDWDHTLRNLQGLDLNLLSLMLYAKSKDIPVGLTTHRDMENTVLYSLYYWQFETPKDVTEALAAAISYWNKNVLSSYGFAFDFINARYQPLHGETNYYQQKLWQLEQKLAQDIHANNILNNQHTVKAKIDEYLTQKESSISNNECKETQIQWLGRQYCNGQGRLTIFHIDDSESVCQLLPEKFKELPNSGIPNIGIETIYYKTSPLFSNESCEILLREIGFFDDLNKVLNGDVLPELPQDNPLRILSLVLSAVQFGDYGEGGLLKIESILKHYTNTTNASVKHLCQLISAIMKATQCSGQPVYIFPNNLQLNGTAANGSPL